MLSSLYINNYALIDSLKINFSSGLTTITGETGAGKSILLGGLALVLGKRADLSQVRQKDKKCIVEAVFKVKDYQIKNVYHKLNVDYEEETILRREILPSGKSRAFINDSPVNLETLSELISYLIDIHSQQDTRQLIEENFHFQILDALANNNQLLQNYTSDLSQFNRLKKSLSKLQASKNELIKEYEYNLFLLNELNTISLETIQLEDLEAEYEKLSNTETIEEKLNATSAILTSESLGVLDQMQLIKQELSKITNYGSVYQNLWNRIHSTTIELNDILDEIDAQQAQLNSDPGALEAVNLKLKILNDLFKKHAVSTTEELAEIKLDLSQKVNNTYNLDEKIQLTEKELSKLEAQLIATAKKISTARLAVIPHLTTKLEKKLAVLGMPNAKFSIVLSSSDNFLTNGKDNIAVLFSANKGSTLNELKKVASGGELSRIMLTIKAILSEYKMLPTIIFDEIDTGVSGKIANSMGDIMKQMSGKMQLLSITHLPQIAAKGQSHFKVYKEDVNNQTETRIKQLNKEERVLELAQMLGGLSYEKSAILHAKELLN